MLDFRFAGLGADNRWNDPGRPALCLAGDAGILITEWGRHFQVGRTPTLRHMTVERAVYRLELAIEHVVDLREADVCQSLSLEDAPNCFADPSIARAAAQALLVPPIAFLDQPERWTLVLFLEKLPHDVNSFISSVTPCGPLRWGVGASPLARSDRRGDALADHV